MEDESHMTEKIWNLTMEIICLLAGEALPLMKFGSHEAITVPPPPSLTPERHTMQKILEVANKITELLTAEVALENSPIKKVKEEAVENAGTRDIEAATNYYIKVTVEDQPLVPAPPSSDNVTKKMCPTNAWFLPDGSSTTNIPERSHQLVYSQDSKQEVTPHHYQAETVKVELAVEKSDHTEDCKDPHRDIKVEFSSLHVTPERSPLGDDGHGASAEDTDVKIEWLGEDECGETSPEIDAAGQYTRSRTVPHPSFSAVGKTEEDDIQTGTATGSFITTDDPRHANPSSSKGGLSDHTAQKREVTSNRRSSKTAIQYSCFKCGKCFIQGAHLINHERVHTGAKPYSCSECGKSFSQYSHRMNHERVHTGEKPYSCSECGKCFSQKAHLINHERIHTGEKPYSCSECGKSFSDRSACVRHERVHTGEKPFSCSECGKSFSDRSSFNMHERLHTGEKPYSCSECGKRYVQKSELLRHERIHTGEKPYSCSVCGKCFSHRSNWTRHEKAHAGEKPYSCSVCGKCFTSNAYRKRHESGHTGV